MAASTPGATGREVVAEKPGSTWTQSGWGEPACYGCPPLPSAAFRSCPIAKGHRRRRRSGRALAGGSPAPSGHLSGHPVPGGHPHSRAQAPAPPAGLRPLRPDGGALGSRPLGGALEPRDLDAGRDGARGGLHRRRAHAQPVHRPVVRPAPADRAVRGAGVALLRELQAATLVKGEHIEDSRDGRVVRLLLDELHRMDVLPLHLPAPSDPRLLRICQHLQKHPAMKPRCRTGRRRWRWT